VEDSPILWNKIVILGKNSSKYLKILGAWKKYNIVLNQLSKKWRVRVIVFNATFNNISVLLVEDHIMLYQVHLIMSGIRTYNVSCQKVECFVIFK
jgi:hypothetical protein